MNNVLYLKGSFQSNKHPRAVVMHTLPKGSVCTSAQMRRLKAQLQEVLEKWKADTRLGICLVSIHYKRIIPKSRRITTILSYKGEDINKCIRGAKFEDCVEETGVEFNKRHVFTYEVSIQSLENAINLVDQCADIVDNYYNGEVNADAIASINDGQYSFTDMKRRLFTGVIADCDVIYSIDVDEYHDDITEGSLISLYKTKIPTKELLRRIGIDITDGRMLDDCTVNLYRNEIDLLQAKAPYMIAMLNDFSKFDVVRDTPLPVSDNIISIPFPVDEPYIGVIDTHFYEGVYFNDWVDYESVMDDNIEIDPEDYNHGTEVTSIIVDGPKINPNLEDGCGRFRVKHFGVAKSSGTSSFELLKKIKAIVSGNREIKVWNLSLGSMIESSENSISAEAAILDQIQSENDVIFVIAGTNDWFKTGNKRIGAPADSINSLVVNAVTSGNNAASYARKGPVLGFFYKPDVSAFGGDTGDYMRVCGPAGEAYVTGTSFAAPWITRKLAFLIYNMGLNREVAKALIIDSAAGWNRRDGTDYKIGYGIVPTHIKDILKTKDDEFRFVITGTVDEYETYNYTIPIPVYNGMHPFWARATMAYFPYCDRNQGVDYTSTEIDLHFGRVYYNNGKADIKEIDNNSQAKEGLDRIYEKDARLLYRKWDNVKYISETPKKNARPKKKYEAGMWGLRIVTKERNPIKKGIGMQFGVVITFKEMNGINRINEFIKLCGLYGWLVTPIDIDASLDLYNKTNAEIVWE